MDLVNSPFNAMLLLQTWHEYILVRLNFFGKDDEKPRSDTLNKSQLGFSSGIMETPKPNQSSASTKPNQSSASTKPNQSSASTKPNQSSALTKLTRSSASIKPNQSSASTKPIGSSASTNYCTSSSDIFKKKESFHQN